MLTPRTIILSITLSFGLLASATEPNPYYLTLEQVADSREILPAPPEENSARWAYDVECYRAGKELRDTERGALAASDARLHAAGVASAMSEAFGTEISPEKTPQIYHLLAHMREDAGDLSTRHAKNKYQRVRPFVYFKEPTCMPDDEAGLAGNGSYPSGHTAIGWATALVLAEINPGRQEEILKRGFEMGQSRVICGYHWQSDVDAARITAAAVVARLHANNDFAKQMQRAKKEWTKLHKKGIAK